MTFSKVKKTLERDEIYFKSYPLFERVLVAFECVTPEHCKNWIRHSGYLVTEPN
jgi:hypothetical protein